MQLLTSSVLYIYGLGEVAITLLCFTTIAEWLRVSSLSCPIVWLLLETLYVCVSSTWSKIAKKSFPVPNPISR
jgi:hypothetical protein